MKSGYKFLIGFFLAIITLPCRADLYSALRYVYLSNPVIGAQRSAVDVAAADLDLARTGYKPYLGLSGNINAARTEILNQKYDYVPTQFGAEFSQPIFHGFATIAKIKAARGMMESETAILYATQQDVFLDAINAYISVMNARSVLDLQENNERVLDEYYKFVRDRRDVGMLTDTDVAQASARLSAAKYNVIDARAKYDNAIETFRRIYGTTESQYSEIKLSRFANVFPSDVDYAQEYALKNHPALVALNAQLDAVRTDITVAQQTRWPSVDVRASVMQADDLPILDRVRDGRIGVYVSLPIYDRGVATASVQRVRKTVDGIQEQIVNARRTIIQNLNQAWNIYNAQDAAITAAQKSIDANRRALDGIRIEQQNGRRTVLDVLNTEQDLLNSRVALIQAQHAKVSAYFSVMAAMGILTPDTLGISDPDETTSDS